MHVQFVPRNLRNILAEVGLYLILNDRYIVTREIRHVGGGEVIATDTFRTCRICEESLEGPDGHINTENHLSDCPIPPAHHAFHQVLSPATEADAP